MLGDGECSGAVDGDESWVEVALDVSRNQGNSDAREDLS